MQTKLIFPFFVIMLLISGMSLANGAGFDDPLDAIENLYLDYQNCSFNNALTYTTDTLHDHIQSIVDYSLMNSGRMPEEFIYQGQCMERFEIVKNEIYDDRYSVVVSDWFFRVQDMDSGTITTKVKRFGFLLEKVEEMFPLLKLHQFYEEFWDCYK